MEAFNISAFEKFNNQWALLTAGTPDDYNMMTISWGGLGTIWGKPAATVYVRHPRYTYEFMEKYEYFTISFFPEEYKKDLMVLGRKSGRDGDKLALTSLTPCPAGDKCVTYTQASETLVCRIMYKQDLELEKMEKEVVEQHYQRDGVHRMYIGEVVEIL